MEISKNGGSTFNSSKHEPSQRNKLLPCLLGFSVVNDGITSCLFFQATVGNGLYRCWGWNNRVSVLDIGTVAWSAPQVQVSKMGIQFCLLHFPFLPRHMDGRGDASFLTPPSQGAAPSPRCSQASALLGNTGFVCGGQVGQPVAATNSTDRPVGPHTVRLASSGEIFRASFPTKTREEPSVNAGVCSQEPAELEMFCLDLETWCWTRM